MGSLARARGQRSTCSVTGAKSPGSPRRGSAGTRAHQIAMAQSWPRSRRNRASASSAACARASTARRARCSSAARSVSAPARCSAARQPGRSRSPTPASPPDGRCSIRNGCPRGRSSRTNRHPPTPGGRPRRPAAASAVKLRAAARLPSASKVQASGDDGAGRGGKLLASMPSGSSTRSRASSAKGLPLWRPSMSCAGVKPPPE